MGEGPAALLWDVDGTLAETEANGHRRAFNQAFAEEGLPWRWDGPTYQRLLAISGGRERMAAYLTTMEGQPPAPERLQRLQRRKQQHYADLTGTGH
jgi:phosphoglycolate phosphatase-like HAD superfamily hydrolase